MQRQGFRLADAHTADDKEQGSQATSCNPVLMRAHQAEETNHTIHGLTSFGDGAYRYYSMEPGALM